MKKINKLFKHKWYIHLFYKFKYVETKGSYREYEKLRVWFVFFIWICIIIASPFIAIFKIASEGKEWFCYPDGSNGREEYVVISKGDLLENETN